ncbi:hypothetical protein ACLKA7_007795 [Drosophila subpalustris]
MVMGEEQGESALSTKGEVDYGSEIKSNHGERSHRDQRRGSSGAATGGERGGLREQQQSRSADAGAATEPRPGSCGDHEERDPSPEKTPLRRAEAEEQPRQYRHTFYRGAVNTVETDDGLLVYTTLSTGHCT